MSVKIEIMSVPNRSGRPRGSDKYPFAELEPVQSRSNGSLNGPSFVIDEADVPSRVLATARKRHKDRKFITRKLPGGGIRVWREA